MKVYVAGASAEVERAERAMRLVRSMGHNIALDWTQVLRAARAQGVRSDADLAPEHALGLARQQLLAIDGSDVLWLLAPARPSVGAWVEFGFALGLHWPDDSDDGPRTVIVSGKCAHTIFGQLPDQAFDTDCEALSWLTQWGVRRAS